MMQIGIAGIATALPQQVITAEELAATHGFERSFIAEKLGIVSKHVVSGKETTVSLASEAVRSVLVGTGTDPSEIQVLLLVTQTPDYLIPHCSALVQAATNLPRSIAAFDVSLGCSGYVYGLSILKGFMQANGFSRGLLVTAETYSRIIAPDDRTTQPLFGDAATATLLTDTPVYRIGECTFGTDGSLAEALILRGSGAKDGAREFLKMDGRAIFNFVLGNIPGDIARCLNANGLEAKDIDSWVFHQASRYILEALAKRLDVPVDRVVVDMEDVGNTTSSTIPIALQRHILGVPAPSNRIGICGFGVGLSWASTVLTRCEIEM